MTRHPAAAEPGDLPEHMKAPAVLATQAAFDEHVIECRVCVAATRTSNACPAGRRLHDGAVRATQAAYAESRR